MALRVCSNRMSLVAGRPSFCRPNIADSRWFSSSDDNTDDGNRQSPKVELLYEGPFASLSLRLKRVSISTAVVGAIGMPLLIAMHGGDVPASGQLAVGGTAIVAAIGSTGALSYCFSPYVHKLERFQAKSSDEESNSKMVVKAITMNILSMRVETVFDPATDVTNASNHRPFCNFVAGGLPMYVHPELIYDDELRMQLVGKEWTETQEKAKDAAKKQDDDDFL